MTTLEHELGLTTTEAVTSMAPQIEALQAVIMEGAVATYLSRVDPLTAQAFVSWVTAHQADGDILVSVFEKYPELLLAVHDEMVAAIEGVKKNIATSNTQV